MVWLTLATVMSFGFGQLFKWAQRLDCYGPAVVATNYSVIAGGLAAYLAWNGDLGLTIPVLRLGALTGACFFVTMCLLTYALTVAEVGAVLTAFRLSILVPIALGMWLWGEALGPLQMAGIVLALVGLVLMTWKAGGAERARGFRVLGILLLVFLVQGWSLVCMRWVRYAGLDEAKLPVLLATTLEAGALGVLALLILRRRPSARDLKMGALIGVYNGLNLVVVLIALSHLSGAVYFPIQGAGMVLLDNLCAHFWWKERLSRAALAGALLGILSIVLVYAPL